MLHNLIKQSIRSLKRQRSYLLINVTGLSIGIACSLLITLYVLYEAGYDRFNRKKDQIYNVVMNFRIGGQEASEAMSPSPLGETIIREIPEVEDFLRMKQVNGAKTLTFNNLIYSEENIIEADSSFFNFFSVPVLNGDPANLLNGPGKIVLSETTAEKIFGKQNPVDEILKIGDDTTLYIVTGVMGDIPGNSHFQAGVLVSMMSDPKSVSQDWGNNNMSTYVLLKPNTDYRTMDDKLKTLTARHVGPLLQEVLKLSFEEFLAKGNKFGYHLQKLTDIHLDTTIKPHFTAAVDPKLLKILSGIALLILLVASVNFTHLSIAQASARSKEVAVRKLNGSRRGLLIIQFLSESILMSLLSTLIGLLLIKPVLPLFNDLLGTTVSMDFSATWYILPSIILFPLLTGIFAGSYPAFFLSSFNPNDILKGGKYNCRSRGTLRNVLVILQFTISIFLIVGTLIMYRQINYMIKRNPGFNKSQLLVLQNEAALGSNAGSFKKKIADIPGVISLTSSSYVPGDIRSNNGYALEGKKDETILMWTNYVDYDFLQTYGMELSSGRFFNKEFLSDPEACLVNESSIKKFNIDPEKIRIMGYKDTGEMEFIPIIGVVKDFVFESRKNQIAPLIIRLKAENEKQGCITVRIAQQNYGEIISKIEDAWQESQAAEPIRYTFMDDIMRQLYIRERQNALIAVISAILAIFVAILGLYGLTSFSVENRTKEIGIRKVMGSSITGICYLITKKTLILITISSFISFPFIYYASGKWLENFYYRIDPGIITFLGGLIITMLIALLTVSYRTFKAAKVNPARSLRYE
jgi:putative ABC transport system permease protein